VVTGRLKSAVESKVSQLLPQIPIIQSDFFRSHREGRHDPFPQGHLLLKQALICVPSSVFSNDVLELADARSYRAILKRTLGNHPRTTELFKPAF
jgi:hypothetical protein